MTGFYFDDEEDLEEAYRANGLSATPLPEENTARLTKGNFEIEDSSEGFAASDETTSMEDLLEAWDSIKQEDQAARRSKQDAWKKNIGLPKEDMLQRDWTKYNRKMSYLYPEIILPGWKRKHDLPD